MNMIFSKSGIGQICLFSFILFCIVIRNEDAFSEQHWQRSNMILSYDKTNKAITFDFQFYHYFEHFNWHNFLANCNFEYSEDGEIYKSLMTVETKKQKDTKHKVIKMCKKQRGERIQFFKCISPNSGSYWYDDVREIKVVVVVQNRQCKEGSVWVERKKSYMSVKWYLPEFCKTIKSIKLDGFWSIYGVVGDDINEVYTLHNVESNSNRLKNTPSELNSEKSDKVEVTGQTDAIKVTGAETGENIKVYTTTGAEILSVVANDDVVNIKLPKNQMYIVKAGQVRCKVAL